MTTLVAPLPSDILRSIDANAADGFQALRVAVRDAGPIDEATRELVLIAAFATADNEIAVRAHTERALGLGVAEDALRHAVLLTLGATTTLIQTVNGLKWIQETVQAVQGRQHG